MYFDISKIMVLKLLIQECIPFAYKILFVWDHLEEGEIKIKKVKNNNNI